MSDDTSRRKFEPPPWEREAFERFEQERAKRRAAEELEAALREVREASSDSAPEPSAPVSVGAVTLEQGPEAPAPDASGSETPETSAAPATDVSPATSGAPSAVAESGGAPAPALASTEIERMLIQLRIEEPTATRANTGFINAVVAFLAVVGVYIVIQAALLFAGSRSSEAAGTMLAATMSLVVLFAGLGFLIGAALLFRKYHR